MLEGKELEGTIGSNNGEPIVKYSVDLTEDFVLDVQVSTGFKVDLMAKVEDLLSKTSIGQKIQDLINKIK
jgi:hypothetical protein